MNAFVAHVAGVDAAVGGGSFGERDDFGGIGIDAGDVFEASGKTDCSFAHGAIDERLHLADFVRVGQAVDRAHDFAAHGVVADQRADVEAEAEFSKLVEPGREIQFGTAAIAGDDGGDAIEQEIIAARVSFHTAFDVRVNVDEAGGEDALVGIDGAGRGGGGKAAYGGDAAVLDGEVGALPGVAAAIDHAGVADQDVVVRGGETREKKEKKG